jgi:hypothetical protein
VTFNVLYHSINIIRVIESRTTRSDVARSTVRERRGKSRFHVGKPETKRPRGRLRLRWEYDIKIDLQVV